MNRYQFIAAHAAQHPVALSCRVLGVSRSGYYAWHGRAASARARADAALSERITAIHQTSRGTYGSPRVQAELRAAGERCGRRRVARLMRQAGLRGCHGRRRHLRTTVPDRQAMPAPDRVERTFAPAAVGAPDRLWVADISYVATAEGWLYLAIVLDAFSRRVVGWAMADHLRTALVLDALAMALRHRQPAAGLIHHSDRGCQYTSLAFGHHLQAAGILPPMGSVGASGPRRPTGRPPLHLIGLSMPSSQLSSAPPIGCGWPISVTSPPPRGGSTWRSSWMPSAGGSLAGRWPTICARRWCWTH